MKRLVMQPFRAPRKKNDKASPSRQPPRRQRKQDKEDKDDQDAHVIESEEATELGLVWPLIIKETQCSDIEKIIDNGEGNICGKRIAIEASSERSPVRHHDKSPFASTSASPNCSEFESFLETATTATKVNKIMSKTDAYWENVLQGEKERLTAVNASRMISVDDFLLGDTTTVDDIVLEDDSDDDNIPIVATIGKQKSNLSVLVEVATQPNSPPILQKNKKPKVYPPFPCMTSHRNANAHVQSEGTSGNASRFIACN
jgi:hypothetical protein